MPHVNKKDHLTSGQGSSLTKGNKVKQSRSQNLGFKSKINSSKGGKKGNKFVASSSVGL